MKIAYPEVYMCICATIMLIGIMPVFAVGDMIRAYIASVVISALGELRTYTAESAALETVMPEAATLNLVLNFYNYTNLDGIRVGDEPRVEEKGPYMLGLLMQKYDITFSESDTVVSYRTFIDYADVSASLPLTDLISSPSLGYNVFMDSWYGSEANIAAWTSNDLSTVEAAVLKHGSMFLSTSVSKLLGWGRPVDEMFELAQFPQPHSGFLGCRGSNKIAAAEVEYCKTADPTRYEMDLFPHARESVYTGLDDPNLFMAAHLRKLPKYNGSSPTWTTFWNEDLLVDKIPTAPLVTSPVLGSVDLINDFYGNKRTRFLPMQNSFGYSRVNFLVPTFTEDSDLIMFDTNQNRVRTLKFSFRYKPFKYRAGRTYLYRFAVPKDFYSVGVSFFNDKEGLQNWNTTFLPGVYAYPRHLCQSGSVSVQMQQYVHVENYPSCNSSVDEVWFDICPAVGMALNFNSVFELGIFAKSKVDGNYIGFHPTDEGTGALLPIVNIGVGFASFNRTAFVEGFFGNFIEAFVMNTSMSTASVALQAVGLIVSAILTLAICMRRMMLQQ